MIIIINIDNDDDDDDIFRSPNGREGLSYKAHGSFAFSLTHLTTRRLRSEWRDAILYDVPSKWQSPTHKKHNWEKMELSLSFEDLIIATVRTHVLWQLGTSQCKEQETGWRLRRLLGIPSFNAVVKVLSLVQRVQGRHSCGWKLEENVLFIQ